MFSAIGVAVLFALFAAVSGAVLGALYRISPSTTDRFFNAVLLLVGKLQTPRYYLAFCFALFLTALALGLLITQSGPGLTPDSLTYIQAGQSVHDGNGFPYLAQPPLYPLSIAALMYLGFGAELAARLIPTLAFALLVFPLFFLGKRTSGVLAGCAASFIGLLLPTMLFATSYAWTEMLFILLSTTAILFLVKFSQTHTAENRILFLAGFFAALAMLTRYMGVALLPVGLIVIVLKNKPGWQKTAYQALLFGLVSFIPIIPWLYRNISVTGELTGSYRPASNTGLGDILRMIADTIANDFLVLVIVALSLIGLAVHRRLYTADSKGFLKYLGSNHVAISFILVYLVTLAVMSSIWSFDFPGPRLLSPVYPFIVLLLVSLTFHVYRQIPKRSLRRGSRLIITIVLISFIGVQAYTSLDFWASAKDGLGFNSPFWRNAQGIGWIASNVPEDATIYSDYPEVIQYELQRRSRVLPRIGDETAIEEFLETIRSEENSYIISFKQTKYFQGEQYLLQHTEITDINEEYDLLVVLADFPDSKIWRTRQGTSEGITPRED